MKHVPGILVAIALLGLTGAMDVQDAKEYQKVYCVQVADRNWPDYQGTYATECLKD